MQFGCVGSHQHDLVFQKTGREDSFKVVCFHALLAWHGHCAVVKHAGERKIGKVARGAKVVDQSFVVVVEGDSFARHLQGAVLSLDMLAPFFLIDSGIGQGRHTDRVLGLFVKIVKERVFTHYAVFIHPQIDHSPAEALIRDRSYGRVKLLVDSHSAAVDDLAREDHVLICSRGLSQKFIMLMMGGFREFDIEDDQSHASPGEIFHQLGIVAAGKGPALVQGVETGIVNAHHHHFFRYRLRPPDPEKAILGHIFQSAKKSDQE